MKQVVIFDLDDTLFKEIDFLESGYRAVSDDLGSRTGLDPVPLFNRMTGWYRTGKNVFEMLNSEYGLELPLDYYLDIYRYHTPCLSLDVTVRDALTCLKSGGAILGILTDGRIRTQMNKIKALGLLEWMDEDLVIVNSVPECFKPNPSGFESIEAAASGVAGTGDLNFTYVGDNLLKDFICPNQRGWTTVCLEDDGRNIHHQDAGGHDESALPQITVKSLEDLPSLLLS